MNRTNVIDPSRVGLAGDHQQCSPDPGTGLIQPMSTAWTPEVAATYHEDIGEYAELINGHYWHRPLRRTPAAFPARRTRRMALGFWRPVDSLLPLYTSEIVSLQPLQLGFHAVASDPEAANSTLPLLVMPDLPSYEIARLPKSARSGVRKSLRDNAFELLNDPSSLLADGYRVAVSAADRTGQVRDADAQAHASRLERRWARGPGIVVTAPHARADSAVSLWRTSSVPAGIWKKS